MTLDTLVFLSEKPLLLKWWEYVTYCSSLTSIVIPDSVTSIGDDTFDSCDKLTIYGIEGSYAQQYASEYNIPFKLIGTSSVTPTEPNTTKIPDKGTTLKSKNTTYKVTKKGSEVSFTKISSTAASVTIPDTVKISGVNYKVTSIASNAFKGNKRLKKVTINKNISSIGQNAFSGCKNIKTIIIKSTNLKSIGQNAFKGIKATAEIKVPSEKLKAYQKLLKGKGQGKKVKITK